MNRIDIHINWFKIRLGVDAKGIKCIADAALANG